MASEGTSIWMFHRIIADEPTAFGLPSCYRLRGTALTPLELERVLDDAPVVLPLDAIEHALARGEDPPPGVVLTFDDGYREHLDVVVPVLTSRAATATFYVATGLHGAADRVGVVDAWYWLIDHAERSELRVPMPNGGAFVGRADTAEGKRAWVTGAPKAALLEATPPEQARMLAALADAAGCTVPSDLSAYLYLCPEDWRSLVDAGMRVGAHSVSHPRLTTLTDADLDAEVQGSLDVISALNVPISFAYPDGVFDDRVVQYLRQRHVVSAMTCESGDAGARDPLRLPRHFVSRDSIRA